MKVLKVKAGETVARRQEKVMEWYLIQEGTVARKIAFAESMLGPNSIIGIMEKEWFSDDYVAKTDCTLVVIPCKNALDLHMILREHENFRPVFLRTAVEQRHRLICLYEDLQRRAALLHSVAESVYIEYKTLCTEQLLSEQDFAHMENFGPLQMQHKVEDWEISNSNSLVKTYLREYMQLMIKDDSMCVGAIMEAAAQMRRVTLGIGEMVNYLLYNRDIFCAGSGDDLFHLCYHMAVQMVRKNLDSAPAKGLMVRITDSMEKLGIYTNQQIQEYRDMCENYSVQKTAEERINIAKEDCVAHILTYAGYDRQKILEFKEMLDAYCRLPDKLSVDNEARRIRKEIAGVFYDVYGKAFKHSMTDSGSLSPIMLMFFHFGFMDVKILGVENANALCSLADSLDFFHAENIFTIYGWLKEIYLGNREPSRNEFDNDYNGYLMEQKRTGEITEEQMQEYRRDNMRKVEFEIKNMFQSAHRATSGHITTFMPVITEDDMLNSVEKMALTAERIESAVNKVRQLDYSVLYREVLFSDPDRGINQEWVMKEVMPDVILLPGTGSRAMMWQETAGAKTDTPARFLFPIFTAADVDAQMVETMGRYRWEICRRIQGVYWNDIREKSLTAEYYDYIQFYKKNNALSADVKEKIKTALTRARNNYREVFVSDYLSWMKYESQGSFRLNKVARDIFIRYCPFAKEVRQNLASNPLYQTAFNKLDIENKKKEQRLNALYDKYQAAGGTLTADLKENLNFYKM